MFQAGHSVPAELVEAIENQASGNMIFRVLAYALAPNPASRFQSLEQFEAAWRRVESHHTEEKEVQATKKKNPRKVKTPKTIVPRNWSPSRIGKRKVRRMIPRFLWFIQKRMTRIHPQRFLIVSQLKGRKLLSLS